jgi:hypothetical protein
MASPPSGVAPGGADRARLAEGIVRIGREPAPLLAVVAIGAGLVYLLVRAQGPVAAVIGALLGAFLLALVAVMSGSRLAADAFAERHARRHGLAYARKGPLPQGRWFLNRQTRGGGAAAS